MAILMTMPEYCQSTRTEHGVCIVREHSRLQSQERVPRAINKTETVG